MCTLAKDTYDMFPRYLKSKLEESERTLTGPGGERLKVYGHIELMLYIERIPVKAVFWVIESDVPALLSLRTMQQHGFVMDLARRRVFIGNKSVRIFDQVGRKLSVKVVAPRNYYIPPKGECVLNGQTKKNFPNLHVTLWF